MGEPLDTCLEQDSIRYRVL